MSRKKTLLIAFTVLTFAGLVGVSLPRLKTHRVQAATEQTVNVQLNATPDIPLEIENPIAVSTPSGLKGLTYTLVNRGDQRLLAVEITWKLHFANGKTYNIVDRADYAFGFDNDVGPGNSQKMEVGSFGATKHPFPVQGVTGEVTFAQFADGTVLGSDQANVLPWLKGKRSASLNEYQKLVQIYRSGGESVLESALVTETDTDTFRGRALRQDLRQLQLRSGIKAVEARLNQVSSMKLSE